MKITVHSVGFDAGQPVPRRYTADGEDVSPPLSWPDLPAGTKELALIVDDPDAPSHDPWVHWVIYRIPSSTEGLQEGVGASKRLTDPQGALQGRNSWGTIGYRGPAPPPGHGTHHYHFKLYALDVSLAVGTGLDKAALLEAMSGHILAEGELVGTYQR